MRKAAGLLRNLVYSTGYLKATVEEGVAVLKSRANDLEAVYIQTDYPDLSARY